MAISVQLSFRSPLTVWITSSLTNVLTPTAIALGNFDGLHRGHRRVVEPIVSQPPSTPRATVVTFQPHPQEFFSGQPRALLTPGAEKVQLLKAMGVEQLVLLPFDEELAKLSPRDFVEEILLSRLQAVQISVGEDFRFGRERMGTAADLEAIAQPYGVRVHIIPLQKRHYERISSSAIREALLQGDMDGANSRLGRPYSLVGKVITGQQLGRTIGFPTANLLLPPQKFLPRLGVYAARVTTETDNTPMAAAVNIGHRPTVGADSVPTVEVHILDWGGDLYGKTLTVSLEQFLRPEQKFASLTQLKAQIAADCAAVRTCLSEVGAIIPS